MKKIIKDITIEILYTTWEYLVSKNMFPKISERLNIWINKLEK